MATANVAAAAATTTERRRTAVAAGRRRSAFVTTIVSVPHLVLKCIRFLAATMSARRCCREA
uniref:Uncharacterized protein n=1 Tax=Oryza nivara TaxID=4536 RepID=A0A0E0GY60_ORYNI